MLPKHEDAFRSQGLRPQPPQHIPEVVHIEGAGYRVKSDAIAIACPLIEGPVDIVLRKEGESEEEAVTIRQTSKAYLVYPDVRFRLLPDGTPFHKTSLAVIRTTSSNH